MRILVLSSSLAPESKSYLLCADVQQRLEALGAEVHLVDARTMELHPVHKAVTPAMEDLAEEVRLADGIVIGMGVHCYSMNDSLKVLLDTCFRHAEGKFYGILCAAGGDRSYLATMHVTQICMNEWRMIQLPRVVYATGANFSDGAISNPEIEERLEVFSKEFVRIGKALAQA